MTWENKFTVWCLSCLSNTSAKITKIVWCTSKLYSVLHQCRFFTARRYASAVCAMAVCPSVCLSVCPSQAGAVSKRLDESSWFWHGGFRLSHTVLYKENCVSPKINVLPSGTLSQAPDLENFDTASRWRCQQNSSSSSTVELGDYTYSTVN